MEYPSAGQNYQEPASEQPAVTGIALIAAAGVLSGAGSTPTARALGIAGLPWSLRRLSRSGNRPGLGLAESFQGLA
jgi:hypothetical protein